MPSTAEQAAKQKIQQLGKITFAEFMRVALYHHSDGYYSAQRNNLADDYYTSPRAHPAFAALIATHLRHLWTLLGRPKPYDVVEIGSGAGVLGCDVKSYTSNKLEKFSDSLRYVSSDLSETELPMGITGCVVSNELLDAFPVHRFQIVNGEVKEIYVTLSGNDFCEVVDEPSTDQLTDRLTDLGIRVPEGHRGEINLGIQPWFDRVSKIIERGFLITIDYGYEGDPYYQNRPNGTLQTYWQHTQGVTPYTNVGKQDITAHVEFTSVINIGRAFGFQPLTFMSQGQYLKNLGIDGWIEDLRRSEYVPQEKEANLFGMRDLIRPDGLGAFKVLIQYKGADLGGRDPLPTGIPLSEQHPPVLNDRHLELALARYPDSLSGFQSLWPWGSTSDDSATLSEPEDSSTNGV